MSKRHKLKRRARIFLQRKVDRKYYVFVTCLLFSAFIWMMMELSERSITSLTYPVEYSEIPEDYVLTDTTVSQIRIQFRSVGFSILAEKYFNPRKPLRIQLNETYPSEDGNSRYLMSRTLRVQLEEMLGQNREVLNISPDTIWMKVSKRVEKKLPVKVQTEINPKTRFFVSDGPFVTPDSLLVAGPASILDTLSSIHTSNEQVTNVVQSDTITTRISPQHPLLTTRQQEVEVYFFVDELTERKIKIPLQVKGLPQDKTLRTFPDSVEVSFTVGLQDYDRILKNEFVAQIEPLNEVDLENVKKLQVELVHYPENITNVSYTPDRVAFVLEEKNDRK